MGIRCDLLDDLGIALFNYYKKLFSYNYFIQMEDQDFDIPHLSSDHCALLCAPLSYVEIEFVVKVWFYGKLHNRIRCL